MIKKSLLSFLLLTFSITCNANLTPGGGGGGNLPPSGGIALLTGRPGGQDMAGGINAGENLLLQSTTDGSKGLVAVPDGSMFIADQDGSYITAGMPAYEGSISQVAGIGGNGYSVLANLDNGTGNTSSAFYASGGRGTWAAPQYMLSGDVVTTFQGGSSTNTSPDAYASGQINLFAGENQDDTHRGSFWQVTGVKNGETDLSEFMKINSDGNGAVSLPQGISVGGGPVITSLAGNLYADTTTVSIPSSSTNAAMMSYTIPANTFNADGDSIAVNATLGWEGADANAQIFFNVNGSPRWSYSSASTYTSGQTIRLTRVASNILEIRVSCDGSPSELQFVNSSRVTDVAVNFSGTIPISYTATTGVGDSNAFQYLMKVAQ